MIATRFLVVGLPALALTLMTSVALAQQTDTLDPDVDVIAIEDLDSLANPEETDDVIAEVDGEGDVIAIEDLESLANPEETVDMIADGEATATRDLRGQGAVRSAARGPRSDRDDVWARSDDNMCYHAPFSSLSYCQSWLKSN